MEKLGRYLQEGWQLRESNQLREALINVLVGAEYYWRKHHPSRAAGLLLESGDLFYLLHQFDVSFRCLSSALRLLAKAPAKTWWEFEIMANCFLLTTCLSIIEAPTTLYERLQTFRKLVPEKILRRIVREDSYRIAIAFRRALRRKAFTPIIALDTKPTRRSRSEFSFLYEYLTSLTERYALIRDGLSILHQLTRLEEE